MKNSLETTVLFMESLMKLSGNCAYSRIIEKHKHKYSVVEILKYVEYISILGNISQDQIPLVEVLNSEPVAIFHHNSRLL